MNKRGHFFVFEGIDGSGKTTQIHLLQQRIEQQGVRCMETKEPTDGPIGSLLRQCLTGRMNVDEYSISAMFAADRLDHLQNETDGLCHKIEEGVSVISDRYVFSNYAYQSVSVPLEWLVQLNAQAAKLLRPDCPDAWQTAEKKIQVFFLIHVSPLFPRSSIPLRYDTASSRCSSRMMLLPARSAIVLAVFKIR